MNSRHHSSSPGIPPQPISPRHRPDPATPLIQCLLFLLLATLPIQAQKPKTITINGTTFLADPALLNEKPKPAPPKKSPAKKQTPSPAPSKSPPKPAASAPSNVNKVHQVKKVPSPTPEPTAINLPPTPSRPFTDTHRTWGPEQTTGETDTFKAGSFPTAWTTRLADNGPEWLEVSFPNPVEISEIRIRETLHPGTVTKVVAHLDEEKTHPLWEGITTPAPAPNQMTVVPKEKITSNRLTIHLDTLLVPGWSEIDSVELLGTDGSRQWASQARASSTIADILIRPQALPTGQENISSCNESFEREVFALANAERQKRNLHPLVWNEKLARAARYHAADMTSNNYFDHDSMIRRTDSPGSPLRKIATCRERLQIFDPSGVGENIAVGQPTPAFVMKTWMNSSGHRANIVRKQSKSIGIGFICGRWLQNFGR